MLIDTTLSSFRSHFASPKPETLCLKFWSFVRIYTCKVIRWAWTHKPRPFLLPLNKSQKANNIFMVSSTNRSDFIDETFSITLLSSPKVSLWTLTWSLLVLIFPMKLLVVVTRALSCWAQGGQPNAAPRPPKFSILRLPQIFNFDDCDSEKWTAQWFSEDNLSFS